MEKLNLLGLLMLIIGVVLAVFTVYTTLILALVGILIIIAGARHSSRGFAPYPIFSPCLTCGRFVDAGTGTCPFCKQPVAAQPQPISQ